MLRAPRHIRGEMRWVNTRMIACTGRSRRACGVNTSQLPQLEPHENDMLMSSCAALRSSGSGGGDAGSGSVAASAGAQQPPAASSHTTCIPSVTRRQAKAGVGLAFASTSAPSSSSSSCARLHVEGLLKSASSPTSAPIALTGAVAGMHFADGSARSRALMFRIHFRSWTCAWGTGGRAQ